MMDFEQCKMFRFSWTNKITKMLKSGKTTVLHTGQKKAYAGQRKNWELTCDAKQQQMVAKMLNIKE